MTYHQSTPLSTRLQRATVAIARSEGRHFEAVAESGAAVERIDIAAQVDRRGDAEVDAIDRCFDLILATSTDPEALNLARVGKVHTANARSLDRIEEEHWRIAARFHALNAEAAGRGGIGECEAALSERGNGEGRAA